jgi:hypothetical protein
VDEKTPIQIGPPPRRMPDDVRRRIRRTVLMPRLFGLIWFFVGVPMLVVFVVLSDPTVDWRIRRDHARTVGVVTAITRDGQKNPFRVAYTFIDAGGALHAGRSFTGRPPKLAAKDDVTIEYVVAHPRWSRIAGMRHGPIPLAMFWLPVFFIVAGGAIWLFGAAKVRRWQALYELGVAVPGAVTGAKWNKLMRMNTGLRSSPRYLYELRYTFRDDRGLERTAAVRTYAVADSLHFAGGDAVTVLFDRADPARSLVVEMLREESTTDRHR